ncbi:autotransporter-associated beta strand repeat-containing protein [Verrucomicrobiaceae bacterium N1E253]|uniref:Autotransporter-associated beta strand repeat-containing protein n=1 Tax=Oceaniferula marina TaxID=2748318 RepID=A0A851GLF9_9BACT|nr:autotransporter-associated beta strand repeat-containing protein [Oceaniferula marina]NWK55590.1 autotransporter-associated beta strand repeat-containing protein [Oceaniferula marina]
MKKIQLSPFFNQPRRPRIWILSSASLVLSMGMSLAADVVKDGAGTDLNAGVSWSGTAPGSDDIATWQTGSLGAGLTIGSNVSWSGIKVADALSDIDVTGAGALTIGSDGIEMSAAALNMSLATNVVLGADQDWAVGDGQQLTVSGQVSGAHVLTINGAYDTTTFNSTLTSTPQLIWAGKTLSDIDAAGGMLGGPSINSGTPLTGSAELFTPGVSTTYQLQVHDDVWLKGVGVELTQVGDDIYAQANWARYKPDSNLLGTDLSDGNNSSYLAVETTLEMNSTSKGDVLFNRSGGNGGTIGGLSINAGTVELDGGNIGYASSGGYFSGAAIEVSDHGVLKLTGAFNAGYSTDMTVNGGELQIVGDQYINNLTLKNGGEVTGGDFRMGFHSHAVLSVEGTSASTITSKVTLVRNAGTGDTVTFDVADVDGGSGVDLNVSGGIGDLGGYAGSSLIKTGDGTLLLSGNDATYGGDTIINGGVFAMSKKLNAGSEVHINAGATMELRATNIFLRNSSSAAVIIDSGTLTMSNGNHNKFGDMSLLSGATWTTEASSGSYAGENFVIRPNSTITVGGTGASTMSAKDGVALESGIITFDVADASGDSAGDLIVNTELENGGGVTKTGLGTMELQKASTYTGGTVINEGTISLGNGGTAGSVVGAIINNSALVVNRSNTITLANDISGSGTLTLLGNGTNGSHVNLTGDNSGFAGNTTIDGARANVDMSGGNRVGSGSVTVADGGQLWLTGGALSNAVTLNGEGVTEAAGQLGAVRFSNDSNISGAVTLAGDSRLTPHSSSDTGTVSGVISGDYGIEKTGSGTLNLTNANTYTGDTHIKAGSLVLGASGSIASSPTIAIDSGAEFDVSAVTDFSLGAGQTLSGSGDIVGDVGVSGTIAPGMSPGTMSYGGALVLFDGSTLDIELNGADNTTGSSVNDLITVAGNLEFEGTVKVDVTELAAFNAVAKDTRWVFITYEGALVGGENLVLGDLPSLTLDPAVLNPHFALDTSTMGEIALIAVPEPSSAALLALGGLALTLRRRK